MQREGHKYRCSRSTLNIEPNDHQENDLRKSGICSHIQTKFSPENTEESLTMIHLNFSVTATAGIYCISCIWIIDVT